MTIAYLSSPDNYLVFLCSSLLFVHMQKCEQPIRDPATMLCLSHHVDAFCLKPQAKKRFSFLKLFLVLYLLTETRK